MKIFLTTLSIFFICCIGNAQVLPAGFTQTLVTAGIVKPTSLAFSPDGRIFVTSQLGDCRVVQNGTLLPAPFTTVLVNTSGERGLLGIAFDPDFVNNNYIYLYYTLPNASNNRVSRFTANGNVALAGSEVVILELDSLSAFDYHNGGCMKFGPDGKLYIAVGENGNGANAQNLDTHLGKILRINSDGTVPSGNPYTTGSPQRQRVWSYGLRNPFTISFQPVTGRLFINDVGAGLWEEINDGTTSNLNYGWPTAEGNSSNPAFTNPVYTYGHGTGTFLGCAITGGTFFNPPTTNYPAQYVGKYFFIDYCQKWINYISTTGATNVTNFATAIPSAPVSLTTGPDGNLYFLSFGTNSVFKIVYSSTVSPVVTQQPQPVTVNAGQSATFTVVASGTAPLTYAWRKNGTNISGATNASYIIPSTVSGDAGQYSVVVTNTAGTTSSNNALLTVNAFNNLPSVTISAPANGASYTAGQTVNFSGSASDFEDGTLPATAFSWEVVFHHDTHTHPGPTAPQGVTNGSFVIPNQTETATNVFYRLYCYVSDSQGGDDTAFVDLFPLLSDITIVTNPAGLEVTIEGQLQTSPYTTSSVEGMQLTIGATSPQSISGVNYNFSNWSDGGTNPKNIFTPVNNTTYTANFSCVASPPAITSNASNNTICSGNSVTLTRFGGALPNGGIFRWYTGSCGGALAGTGNSITVTPPTTTTYYLRSEATCGNSTCGTITITVAPFIASVAPSGTASFCAGSSTTLTANVGSGITYQWYRNGSVISGATLSTYAASNSGTFYVSENSTCGTAQSNSVLVSQINNPDATISYNSPLAFCAPGSVLLTANTYSGVTYQWQKNGTDIAGATNQTYSATTNGTYRVRQTANGCSKYGVAVSTTTTTSVSAVITANGPVTFCSGGSVVLSVTGAVPGYSYQWKNNNVNIGGATTSSYTATAAGSFTCTVTANCGTATSNAIVVSTGGITAGVTPSGSVSICSGGTAALSANTGSGYTFQWKLNGNNIGGATSSSYNATAAGSYTVAITSPCGNATSAATTVTIAAVTASMTPSGTATICAGSAQTFTANTGYNYTYKWFRNGIEQAGATSNTYSNSSYGTYTVRITQGGTCSATSAVTQLNVTSNPTATITAGGPTTFCAGQSVTLTSSTFAGVSYQWQKNSTNIAGATNQTYAATTTGAYRVKQTANGCTLTSSAIAVTVNCRVAGVSVSDEVVSDVVIKVMPNPFTDELTVYGVPFTVGDRIQLINVLGEIVFAETVNTKQQTVNPKLKTVNLPSGIYFLQVTTSSQKKTVKVVKQ